MLVWATVNETEDQAARVSPQTLVDAAGTQPRRHNRRVGWVTSSASARLPDSGGRPPADGSGLAIITESVECGGTERVVQALADRFPAASIVANHFTDLMRPDPNATPWAMDARLLPSGRRKRHFLGPLYARRLAAAPVEAARVVLALPTGGWSLAAPVPPGGRLVCYATGPPPALYGEAHLYLRSEPAPVRPLMRAALPALRAYYRRLMQRPDRLVAVSRGSAAAIARVYGRKAEVVHPPVRTEFFTAAAVPKRHFVAVARMVPQKKLDELVDAFRGLEETLVLAGRGPWLGQLRARAPSNVRFAGWVDDSTLRELYRSSRALVCPSVEEFGIVMAEAHACGVPVIAPRAGGACEIVDHPATGILLDRVDAGSIAGAVRDVASRGFDSDACRESAERFAEERFVARMEQIVAEELAAA
jgi:glycosyltransferase involved in cell wall biosynthesis